MNLLSICERRGEEGGKGVNKMLRQGSRGKEGGEEGQWKLNVEHTQPPSHE